MDTKILKLDPPYNYIYCNGSIGLHIATLIVYETKTDENGSYQLETHSHPIVKYSNCPAGTVWNRAELTDCNVLCSEKDKRVSMNQFLEFSYSASRSRHSKLEELNRYVVSINAPIWKRVFDLNGIEIEWPIIEELGRKYPQDLFSVELCFEKNPKGSSFKYSCYSSDASDIIFTGGVVLSFSTEFNTKKDLELLLRNFMFSYYIAFRDRQFVIKFHSANKSEFDSVIEKINSQEESIRQDSNEIDV